MSESHEWEEVHLTSDGWIEGSCKLDFGGLKEKPCPADRFLTVRREVRWGKYGAPSSISSDESIIYCDANRDSVILMLLKHGKPGFSV